jgi:hypothetical protein
MNLPILTLFTRSRSVRSFVNHGSSLLLVAILVYIYCWYNGPPLSWDHHILCIQCNNDVDRGHAPDCDLREAIIINTEYA